MADEIKTQIPYFNTTNWFNNSGIYLSDTNLNTNFDVFNNYFDMSAMTFDSFNNQSFIPNNYNLNFNMPNFIPPTINFDFSAFSSFLPNFGIDFSTFFTQSKPTTNTSTVSDYTTVPDYTTNVTLAGAEKLFETPKLTKPTVSLPKGVKPIQKSVSTKTGKTVKAYSGNGLVDTSVYETKINGTTIHKLFSSTNLDLLKPDLKHSLEELSKLAQKNGYILVVSDGYRSLAEQANAKKKKPNLCAAAGKSPHNYGCAIDIALYKNWGDKPTDITTLPWFYNYAKKELGLSWGQDWSSKKESWHFERKGWNEPGSDVYLAYCKNNGIKSNVA